MDAATWITAWSVCRALTEERSFVAALLRMTDEILDCEAGARSERGVDSVPRRGAASSAPTDDHSAEVKIEERGDGTGGC